MLISFGHGLRMDQALSNRFRLSHHDVVIVSVAFASAFLTMRLFQGNLSAVITLFLYVTLAESWNLIGGYGGYASLGQVAFFGFGGYIVGLLMVDFGMSFWIALLLGGVASAVYAGLLGLPLLRLRGPYFSIATLVAAEATKALITWWIGVTRVSGITITTIGLKQSTHYLGQSGFLIVFGLIALLSIGVVAFIAQQPQGYALILIRENEFLAPALGINARSTKVAIFAVSGFLAGIAGGTEAFREVILNPNQLFDPRLTVLMVAIVVVGGAGTVLGPVYGAIIIAALTSLIRLGASSEHNLTIAIVIIVGVLVSQGSLASLILPNTHSGNRLKLIGESFRARLPGDRISKE